MAPSIRRLMYQMLCNLQAVNEINQRMAASNDNTVANALALFFLQNAVVNAHSYCIFY